MRLKYIHKLTSYKERGNKEFSSARIPQGGLRESCPSSPILLDIFQQVVLRGAEEQREDSGIQVFYVPGNPCMTQRRDQPNCEAVQVQVKNAPFCRQHHNSTKQRYNRGGKNQNQIQKSYGVFPRKVKQTEGRKRNPW